MSVTVLWAEAMRSAPSTMAADISALTTGCFIGNLFRVLLQEVLTPRAYAQPSPAPQQNRSSGRTWWRQLVHWSLFHFMLMLLPSLRRAFVPLLLSLVLLSGCTGGHS